MSLLSCLCIASLLLIRHFVTKDSFTKGLSHSKTLQTLVDADHHVDHGIQLHLDEFNAQYIMLRCRSLKKIITNQRIWTVRHMKFLLFSSFVTEVWFVARIDR